MTGRFSSHRAVTPGLTLVEVMIVVIVLSILAVTAVPMFAQTDGTRLRAAAELLIADLQFAQMRSLSHPDELCGIRFDTDAES